MYTDIIVTGSIAFDDIMNFPGYFKDYIDPKKLHMLNVSFAVDRLEKQIGGTGMNIAYNLYKTKQLFDKIPNSPLRCVRRDFEGQAKFEVPNKANILLMSSVGKDGGTLFHWMKKQGLDTSGILVDKKLYTATGKVITDKKDNQIWGFYYGASRLSKNLKLITKSSNTKDTLLIISATHSQGFLTIQRQAIQLGIDYVYDPGMALTWINDSDLKKGVLHAKWVVGNDYEIGRILDRINMNKKQLFDKGISVITTLGEKGVIYESSNEHYMVPAYSIKKIIDPTGAGDAWRGGFMAGISSGLPIKTCLLLGNVMASFAVETYGTVMHNPNVKEFRRRYSIIDSKSEYRNPKQY